MTSSTKPEVHNVSHRREEDYTTATSNMYGKFGEIWPCDICDMQAGRQTDIQDRQAGRNTSHPYWGEVG